MPSLTIYFITILIFPRALSLTSTELYLWFTLLSSLEASQEQGCIYSNSESLKPGICWAHVLSRYDEWMKFK